MAATKMTAPNGAMVSVASEKVEGLLRRGFTKADQTTKTTSKKSSSKSSK